MNSKALYFSLYCRDLDHVDYYSMLHHALQTLEFYLPRINDFDVVVFYSTPNFDFNSYMHLDKFNLKNDFPWVNFYQSSYKDKHTQMHKWFNLSDVFDLGYNNVFYLDCDVIFSSDPCVLFDLYQKEGFYCIHEGRNILTEQVLGRNGIASGQWFIDSKTFNLTNNLYDCIVNKQQELIDKAHKVLSRRDADGFTTLSEQYAAQMVLIDQGIELKRMVSKHVNWHDAFNIQIDKKYNLIKFIDLNTAIVLHYLGKNSYLALPENLKTKKMIKRTNEYLRKSL